MNTQTTMNDNDPYDISQERKKFVLSNDEKDALGEISNICMGTSATTLSELLGKRVTITTPRVNICLGNEYLDDYEKPIVLTEVSYTQGLDGVNTFLIKKEDALLITGLLMGTDISDTEASEEFYMSAISEVMNQMVGTSSTALANTLQIHVNISPPVIRELTREQQEAERRLDGVSIVISFRMEIQDLLVSNIMQIMPYEFGKKLATSLNNGDNMGIEQMLPASNRGIIKESVDKGMDINTRQNAYAEKEHNDVELKAVKFQTFDNSRPAGHITGGNNIDLIIDVPLQVTVVLGKTKKSIKEILDLGMGSVIVLDRLAGEMVDVLVNGKLFARGEVVVINDNYGVRITELAEQNQTKAIL